MIDCSAEPSVTAGYSESPEYLINTNLVGTINCLELAREKNAAFLFLSTSRVYPIKLLNSLRLKHNDSRYILDGEQKINCVSHEGISEDFPLNHTRSLYGTTKVASEVHTRIL